MGPGAHNNRIHTNGTTDVCNGKGEGDESCDNSYMYMCMFNIHSTAIYVNICE